MQHFNNRIKTEQGFLSFYFNEETHSSYYVSVIDKYRKAHLFNMKKTAASWFLQKSDTCCEDWIVNLESLLSNEIIIHTRPSKN